FYEDFTGGFPSGWTFLDNNGNNWNWVINDAAIDNYNGGSGPGWTSTGPLLSTSGGNHMLLWGDDYNGGSGGVPMDSYFQTDAIDLTGFPAVEIEFQHKLRYCCSNNSQLSLFVSNDNVNWTEYDAREGIVVNTGSADPLTTTFDISCIAGNQSTVYLRWHKIGASHYYWMVDDILIRESAVIHDLSIEFDYYLDPWLAPHFSMIPANHVDTSLYAVEVKNNMPGIETGVILNVTVNDGANDVYNGSSASDTINGCVDSTLLACADGFFTTNIGSYTVNLDVSLDSADFDLSNNSVSHSFDVTDTVFARDFGGTQYQLTAADYSSFQPYGFGNWYDFVNADTITSISFQLGTSTVIGTVVQGTVYDNDVTTILGTTGYHTVASGDLGNWVTLSLATPLAVPAISARVVAVNEFGGTDTNMTIYGSSIPQLYGTSFLIHSSGNTWIGQTPNVRANVKSSIACNLSASSPAITTISCNGGSDGAVSGVVPSGGTGSYTYLWSPGGATSADISGLTPGIYTLTITDSVGCVYIVAADVAEPDVLTVVPVVTDITCNGTADGSVAGGATGGDLVGSSAITYFSENFSSPGMPSGFTLFDVDGNTPNPAVTALGFDGTDATAWVIGDDGSGSNNVAISNSWYATAGTSDDWMITDAISIGGSNVILSWDAQAVDPSYPDGYEVRISTTTPTVAACLANSALFTIGSENATLTSRSVDLTAVGYANQTVYIAFRNNSTDKFLLHIDNILVETPAVASAYQYSFDGGAYSTASSFTGLGAGTYPIKVMDAKGCEDSTTVTIVEPAAMGTAFSSTTANCGVGGSATVTVSGGSTPYTYLWDDLSAQTTATANGLVAGYYTVNVTDSNGCIGMVADSVLGTPPITLDTAIMDPSGCGLLDGYAVVSVLTGTAPYNYAWDDPGTQSTDTASGLSAGIYNVTVTDIKFCVGYATVVLSDAGAPTVIINDSNQVSCMGGSDGSATTLTFGGTGALTYSWSTTPAQDSSAATGLSAGTYTVTVTDANNCSGFTSTTITEPSTAVSIDNITVTNVSCNGGSDGTVTIITSGGMGAHAYSWSNSQTTQNISGLTIGAYTVVVTDTNGCTANATSDTLTEPSALFTSAVGTNVTCSGENDGAVDLTVSGGVAPYGYSWSPGGETSEDLSGQGPGPYSVVVTDANGCTANAVKTLTEPNAIVVSTSLVTDVSTNGGSDGAIVIATPTGGTGAYTYSWIGPSFTSTSANISNLEASNYSLIVTDENGCTGNLGPITINEPPVSVSEVVANATFSIYPNPNTGKFMVEMNNLSKEDYLLEIRNIIGQLVIGETISNVSGNHFKMIDLTKKERGVYFVSITNKNSTITKKLVVY
ncbi:MAG TPA: T9SS type A sorting domain-containing protein, partial [Flavobacteriales bacterium]|nr:T9SS type A sorting domain-containing protein [Flavobacteriales bacterium]